MPSPETVRRVGRTGLTGTIGPAEPGALRRAFASIPAASVLVVAALTAASPARALDREKATAAPTMEPCPAKGPGFVRLPGGTTCTRLSGRVAAGADLRAGTGGTALAPHAAGRLAIDNRTDSDLGEVRTYVRIGNGRR